MSIFNSINVSATALTAEKTRIDIIAKNMANASTTRSTGGMPYRRQMVVFEENKSTPFSEYLSRQTNKFEGKGVKISKIVEDESPFKLVYEPGHPDADENGYVKMPNVDTIKEMVDLISAQRSYDANITAMNASKSMLMKALEIGRR
ncbi:flagellar basal body rod protein FlgC [Tissierella carlieri]|jgi:flagellar basal-body rod protein FlgC|uniref:Flagellar basal-body rod protein FlgC n=1 Tax=Tissierella carlieri TaxID=689904 RepID=A0ABT1S5R1_9FIRM|nr:MULTISPECIES: flagellar basal body rod protein FlgC [Tissierella]MBU5314220.1 flagellar basal body rod protein FlgC [Tissierella carlieri]MCQ4921800.1 flagellar basal body rod protein FlgC [Tissierella carlieri]MDU5079872.1 flagellar basal body rod protein FlgC [Bacillota bacterium]OZV12897.1 flagellar basal body rod protein FlgC [Tissierella sp. P1]